MTASVHAQQGAARALPPVAAKVDRALVGLDARVNWLTALSPIHNDALWEAFQASSRRHVPPLEYRALGTDLHQVREELLALPVEDIESPLLQGLLAEKQRELDRQIELVRLRGTDGFVNASIDLFGGVEPGLKSIAREILEDIECGTPLVHDAGIDEVLAAVRDDLDWYRERAPGFNAEVVVDPDMSSLLMVSHGRLYIDGDIRLPVARVQPLVQHEVGTHLVTRHNGGRQALTQLEVGLAHYDALQEGLGVLAEYLAGFLPAERLRVLAARVIATDMAMHSEGIPAIFAALHDGYGLPTEDAFDIAVRALRGGGLTKDAVYLRGLRELLEYLHEGGAFEPLFTGKFALSHMVVLEQLIDEGWVRPPELMPRYWSDPVTDDRLAHCRSISVSRLCHKEPIR
ncbi:flavohemoglobin expression-modulating QEGLA motif protein [Lysobacter sp. A3-1-A15]|uniref:flavohemoglobin expression-modulating QEGLA motif protein n=1 Tax=Novilysobacter viscosus TaxID=3098602 RepID=UPI002ED9D90E